MIFKLVSSEYRQMYWANTKTLRWQATTKQDQDRLINDLLRYIQNLENKDNQR